jgi:beta-galactosidase
MLFPPARAQQETKPFDLIAWNGGKFIYGVDYYPEAWNEGQWAKDAAMMQAAGINFVRLAEFAWVKLEPREGKFDFDWLDRALKVLNAHSIKAVLGTPTASPPAWLYAQYPDIAAMDENGVRYRYGSRRNYCLHNPHFIAATQRIVTAMAEHYKNHPGVLGWQIDNELGDPECFDAISQAAFQKWCQRKYKTLEALNKAWGTVFWGHTYQTWAEIPLPWNTLGKAHNPSLALDFRRFHSDSTHDYLKIQTTLLRRIAPTKAITHNEMGLYDNIDYSDLNRSLDFVAWDNYPMFGKDYANYLGAGLAHDLMRGSKNNQNFMVMEQEGGLPGWSVFWGRQAAPGLYRVWAYQAVAHGADGVCYFRWRTSRYGTEQYWQGVLDQDSYPNERYKIVAQTGKELAQLTDLLHGSRVVAPAALLISPESRWAFHIQPLVEGFNYDRQLHLYYDAFRRAGIDVDVLFPQSDFSPYKIIVAPSLFVVDKSLAAKLASFVNSGGTLILSYRSGVKDEHNVVTDLTLPGPLAELAGVAIHDFDPQITQEQDVVTPDGTSIPAHTWFDILDPTTAETILTYGKGYYAGKAAVTQNHVGTGSVYYVGTEIAQEYCNQGIKAVAEQVGISPGPSAPEGVELAAREKEGKRILFLLNYTDQPQKLSLGQSYRNALSGEAQPAEVQLAPFDVKVLTTP